jgi:alkanesulfonate monooxygenase SsuD/methylene tetrahydromethanopterin reductase-like flavin-dependent oxidoreductase (luciferase family)
MIVGSAADVRDRLSEMVETLGVEEMAIEMGFPGMLEDTVARQIRLFAEGVRPALDELSRPNGSRANGSMAVARSA